MASAVDDLYNQLQDYDFVRFTWADLHGMQRGVAAEKRNLRKLLEGGFYAWRGSNIVGPDSSLLLREEVNATGQENMCIKPRPGTAHPLNWAGNGKYKVGQVLCNCHYTGGGLIETCTYNVANKQVERLDSMGYKILSGYEMEFTLLDGKSKKPAYDGTEMFGQSTLAEVEDYVYDLDKYLEAAGVETETLHPEWGCGQFEITLIPQWGMKMADNAFLLRGTAKEVAKQNGYQAVFIAKPYAECMTNGGHYNISVWDKTGTKNMFTDETATSTRAFSKFGYHWLAGMCKHAPALTALCNPTVSCYRRLTKPWTPVRSNWGFENRSACYRLKGYGFNGSHIENRMPGCAFNPYLVLAGTIAAGIDGIENQLECPAEAPADGNTGGVNLPNTLQKKEFEIYKRL